MTRGSRNVGIIAWVSLLCCVACNKEKSLFTELDVAKSGITFENKLSPTEDFNIIDYIYFYNGGGVAAGDVNGDDLPDLFFSGNQVKNKLYLNKGNLQFEDITDKAGVAGNSTWNTGSVMGDVNGDGLLDIYVCAVVGLKNLNGHNELYINNGDNTFTERSSEFGLDFESYSSSAAFLDYDLDGDLDMYLLNHAVHTPASFGHANLRNTRVYESGGKLLRNDGTKFTDVSEQAHIYGGVNGYGLGVSISDFNIDGYPDIYVGNDFHEDDYFYLNNGDGTFREVGKSALSCTSKFSMGNDAADINHDGYPDLITLDMLPEDEDVLKRSVDEENISIMKLRTQKYGYNYQFPRNMLQINQGNGTFAETALLSNVAATDWSWSALFADFDQDGNQDLFISNGIPRRPNDLDYIKYVSSEQIVNKIGTTKLVDEKALALMPSGAARNYVFKGSGDYGFQNMSPTWLPGKKTCSTATALADLDNDGDLDVVINNVDALPDILINQTNGTANYLKLKIRGSKSNPFGLGTRVYSYHNGVMQMKEVYSARGFQASSEPIIHFGYGAHQVVDSIKIVWPGNNSTLLTQVKANQTLVVAPESGKLSSRTVALKRKSDSQLFKAVNADSLGIGFIHHEDEYSDFDRLKLLPYRQSDKGPATAVGDIDGDGNTDVFFGGAKRGASQVFLQRDGHFIQTTPTSISADSLKETIDAIITDLNGDGKADVYVGTGGADFYGRSKPLLDSYFLQDETGFKTYEVEGYYENASCVKAFDFDKDGDQDLFVGNQSVSNDFGKLPKSYLLQNNKGQFTPVQASLFDELGMVTDATWFDYNNDGAIDLVIVGEWMSPVFLKNNNGVFQRDDITEKNLNGLWQSVSPFDIDHDGDVDVVLGNWGLNSKFRASKSNPMKMYYGDIDGNGHAETILAIEKKGKYYPLEGLDVLASQLSFLKKKYTTYQDFAGKTVDEVFGGRDGYDKAAVLEVHELATGCLRNDKGKFTFVPLPAAVQTAPVLEQLEYDFDRDGTKELLLAGNYFGVQPFHGRFGSFAGALVKSSEIIVMGNSIGLDLMNRSVRHLNIVNISNKTYLLVTVNDGKSQLYELLK